MDESPSVGPVRSSTTAGLLRTHSLPFCVSCLHTGQVRLEEQHGRQPPRVVMTTAGEELLVELDEEDTRHE